MKFEISKKKNHKVRMNESLIKDFKSLFIRVELPVINWWSMTKYLQFIFLFFLSILSDVQSYGNTKLSFTLLFSTSKAKKQCKRSTKNMEIILCLKKKE